MKGLILAIQFLTRIPLPISVPMDDKTLRKSLFFFPWVGTLIGVILFLAMHIFKRYVPEGMMGYLILLLWMLVVGGIHLDGVADTWDGFFSHTPRERTLEIMKDSRLGTFGGVGLILLLLGKYVGITHLQGDLFSWMLIPGGARLANLFALTFCKNARPGGMGDMFARTQPKPFVLATAVLFLTMAFTFAVGTNRFFPLCILLAQGLTVGWIAFISYKKIGGLTGDVYGLNVETAELVGLFVAALL